MLQKSRQNKWKQVLPNEDSCIPSPRWGHASLVIGKELIIYGGYADTIYRNDIWSYDAELKEWKEIKTWGKIPENRSNCSMSYDAKSNKLIVFGGGGSNKRKFNSIYSLDWKTKEWRQIIPKSQKIPEQRTYHSAQFVYPYLVVFGGQALIDLDDLWTFNVQTSKWEELEINNNFPKPSGRRFHSSLLIDNKMVIIGGCFSRYRSLNDVWSIDLTSLQQNKSNDLKWKQHKLQGTAFLTRWGHSSSYYKNKIYVFGGRFSSDLNDLLVIDLEMNTIKAVNKAIINAPSPRRRHSSAFIGASLVIFGGFNGQYYNDLYFLTFNEELPSVQKSKIIQKLQTQALNPSFSNIQISLKCGQTLKLNKWILQSNILFNNNNNYNHLIQSLTNLSLSQAKQQLKHFYSRGTDIKSSVLKTDYKQYLKNLQHNLGLKKSKEVFEMSQLARNFGVLRILDEQWLQINKTEGDIKVKVTDKALIRTKKALLSLNSQYFNNMLNQDFFTLEEEAINIKCLNDTVIKVLMKFLQYDVLFIPQSFEQEDWIQLILLSKFYHMKRLTQICEYELIVGMTSDDCLDLLKFALSNKLKSLESHCLQTLVRDQCSFFASDGIMLRYDHYQPSIETTQIQKRISALKRQKHQTFFFDIQQNISTELALFPRQIQQKLSMKRVGSKRQALAPGKENTNVLQMPRQL